MDRHDSITETKPLKPPGFAHLRSTDIRKKRAQEALRAAAGNPPGKGRVTCVEITRDGTTVCGNVFKPDGTCTFMVTALPD